MELQRPSKCAKCAKFEDGNLIKPLLKKHPNSKTNSFFYYTIVYIQKNTARSVNRIDFTSLSGHLWQVLWFYIFIRKLLKHFLGTLQTSNNTCLFDDLK